MIILSFLFYFCSFTRKSEQEVSVLRHYCHDLHNSFDMKTVKFNAQAQFLW